MEKKLTINLTDFNNLSNWIDSENNVWEFMRDEQAKCILHMFPNLCKEADNYSFLYRVQRIANSVLEIKKIVYDEARIYFGNELVGKVNDKIRKWIEEDKKNRSLDTDTGYIEGYRPNLRVKNPFIYFVDETKEECKFRCHIKLDEDFRGFYLNFKLKKKESGSYASPIQMHCFESRDDAYSSYKAKWPFEDFYDGTLVKDVLYPKFTFEELKEFDSHLSLNSDEAEPMCEIEGEAPGEVIKISEKEFKKLVETKARELSKKSKIKK